MAELTQVSDAGPAKPGRNINPFQQWIDQLRGFNLGNEIQRFNQGAMNFFGEPSLETPVSPDLRNSIAAQLNQFTDAGSLTPQQHATFAAMLEGLTDSTAANDLLNQITLAAQAGDLARQNERTAGGIRERATEFYNRYAPLAEEQFTRFDDIVKNPSKLRSDQELGDALASAEGTINADLLRGKSQLSRNLAVRGVASSGKASGLARGLEERGAITRAGTFNEFSDQARSLRDRYDTERQRLSSDRDAAFTAADTGNFQMGYNLLGRNPDYAAPIATALDTAGLRIGNQRANLGFLLDNIYRGASLGVNAGGTALQGVQGFLPWG